MTPRERVLAALNHKETDKVPADCYGHRLSAIAAIAYNKLIQHFGLGYDISGSYLGQEF
jgi:uroporphyrinogen decarboxylase